MRSKEEMLSLITSVAREDPRIRAVMLSGSRTDPDAVPDEYQDYDVVYFVRDVSPFWDNTEWVERSFGRPALMQKPETMRLIPPDGDGKFVYLMLFPDGNRIDLSVTSDPYEDDGEPVEVLLDKDGIIPPLRPERGYWFVKRPDQKRFSDCSNEFYWCLQNVAKGLARDEVSYAMDMRENPVRNMLIQMISWRIGADRDFRVSVGKRGKRFKDLLPEEEYDLFLRTYSDAAPENAWKALRNMVSLFGRCARHTAQRLGFRFREDEEKAALIYMDAVYQKCNRNAEKEDAENGSQRV